MLGYNFSIRQKKVIIKSKVSSLNQSNSIPKIRTIFNQPILSSFQVNQNSILFSNQKGEIFNFNFNNQSLTKKDNQFKISSSQKIKQIIWSSQEYGQGILILENKNREEEKKIFDLNKNKYFSLNSHIQQVNFSPDGRQIIYQYYNPDKNESFISIADSDGKNWKNIISSRLKNIFISWGRKEMASFYSQRYQLSSLFSLNLISHQIHQIFSEKEKIEVTASPFSKDVLASFLDKKNGVRLYLINLDNNTKKLLQIKTFAHKCVFASKQKIYCAVPKNNLNYSTLKLLIDKNKLITQDDLFLINVQTGQSKKIFIPERDSFDAQEIKISPNQKYLFLIGRLYHWLYQVRI
ncbi:MAG TPA: hypothetical protein ENL06_01900 [Candidatus Portnoybacteria bacterium]|nr:hypothetical protein [Candidatus Portnoybacteria bacterium]